MPGSAGQPGSGAAGEFALGDTVLSASQISERTGELARQIDAAYSTLARPLVLVCILKGSFFFTADLARRLSVPIELDFMAVRSYGARVKSSGTVELVKDISTPLGGRDVLLVEDIVDTGLTTAFLHRHLQEHAPGSLEIVSLLYKETGKQEYVACRWTGFTIPDRFVVGYGLDYDEQWRNLEDIREMIPAAEKLAKSAERKTTV